MVHRGEAFTSDDAEKESELRHVHKALSVNNFPNRFIKNTRRKLTRRAPGRDREENEQKPLVVLPYVRGVTERVTRILAPHAKVATRPGKNLKSMLVRPKDKRDKGANAGLVYQYECKVCKKVYVGETGRTLKVRESEHKRAIRNGDENHSGISKHVIETGHAMEWEGVKILAYETNWKKRKIKEGIFIAKTKNSMLLNTKPGVPLNTVYRVL